MSAAGSGSMADGAGKGGGGGAATTETADAVVLTDITDGIATLTVNRPKALNALNSEVLSALHEAVEAVKGKADAIIVTGAGEKAFVAGADIAEMADCDRAAAQAFSRRGQLAFQSLQDFPGPVIAAVRGFALGGGLEVALACDIIVASEEAKLGLPETTLGLIPGFGGTQRLPRRIGPGMAKKFIFTGKPVDAATALAIGLVDEVCAPDALMETARTIATLALRNGPLAVAEAKRMVNEGLEMPLGEAVALEAERFGDIFETADAKEGIAAFLQKRRPSFQGR